MFERLKELKPKTETLPSMSLVIKNTSESVVKVYFFSHYDVSCKFTLKYISIKAGETRFIKDVCPKSKYLVYQNGVALMTENTVKENYKCFSITDDGIYDISEPTLESEPLNEGLGPSKTTFSFLIKNCSQSDCQVYFYSRYDLICKVSLSSIIVQSGQTERRDVSPKSKYEIWRNGVAITELRIVKREDIYYRVTETGVTTEHAMAEKTRRELVLIKNCEQFLKESKSNGVVDHYAVLGLSMGEVRAMSYDDQTKQIRAKYRILALENHPDRGNSSQRNKHIWNLVCEAYKVLEDPEIRVRYHNEFDFKQPYREKAFWRSLFWPEVYSSLDGVKLPDVARMKRMRFEMCRNRVLYFFGSGKIYL